MSNTPERKTRSETGNTSAKWSGPGSCGRSSPRYKCFTCHTGGHKTGGFGPSARPIAALAGGRMSPSYAPRSRATDLPLLPFMPCWFAVAFRGHESNFVVESATISSAAQRRPAAVAHGTEQPLPSCICEPGRKLNLFTRQRLATDRLCPTPLASNASVLYHLPNQNAAGLPNMGGQGSIARMAAQRRRAGAYVRTLDRTPPQAARHRTEPRRCGGLQAVRCRAAKGSLVGLDHGPGPAIEHSGHFRASGPPAPVWTPAECPPLRQQVPGPCESAWFRQEYQRSEGQYAHIKYTILYSTFDFGSPLLVVAPGRIGAIRNIIRAYPRTVRPESRSGILPLV